MPAPRNFTFRGSTKSISAASQTIQWTSSEIVGTGVVAYVVKISGGTGNNFFGSGGIEDVIIKAGANPIIDVNYKQFNAWTGAYSSSNLRPMDGSSKVLEIPLYFLDGETDRQKFQSGFPPGLAPQVELKQGSSFTDSFDVQIGYWIARQVPDFTPNLLRSSLGFTASTANEEFNLTMDGRLRAICMPTRGVTQAKCRIGGVDVFDSDGPNASTEGDMIQGSQMYDNGQTSGTYGDHFCLRLETGELLSGGRDRVQFTTGSDYQTSTPDDEIATYTLVDNGG